MLWIYWTYCYNCYILVIVKLGIAILDISKIHSKWIGLRMRGVEKAPPASNCVLRSACKHEGIKRMIRLKSSFKTIVWY